jgi:hypothetical protein
MISPAIRLTTVIGSLITIGFGAWHLFVPRLWHWYHYIEEQATELVAAVRAINFFFSISLVLFGITNIVFVYRKPADPFYLRVQLLMASLLWGARVVMQLLYPQGTINPALRYGMLATFVLTFALFLFAYAGSAPGLHS